jgi:ferric-dicitrate binding protein FerR (iron transport regulator)
MREEEFDKILKDKIYNHDTSFNRSFDKQKVWKNAFKTSGYKRRYMVAAAIGVAILLSVFLMDYNHGGTSGRINGGLAKFKQAPSPSVYKAKPTQIVKSQKKQLTLPDGSMVWVNAGSELKYPEMFEGKTREVYLTGEAYFDVQHDASKKFIIHTGKVVTKVLGTAFNIKEDKNKETIVVTVTRGKVKVANGSQELGIITRNQQISFNLTTNKSVKTEVNASEAIAWQEAELHFDDVTFAEVAEKLQQRFNVEIRFANNKLKTCRFTGTAASGEKLEKVLKVICAFNNAAFKKQDDGSILISGRGCN